MTKQSWSITNIWNETLESERSKREMKPRDVIWASEIGSPFIDRWLKMKGIQPTNPFEPRMLRVFEAGRTFEWLVKVILLRAGLLRSPLDTDKFNKVTIEYDKCLKVWGKFDLIGGGEPDYDKAKDSIKDYKFPIKLEEIAINLIKLFSEKYPKGLEEYIIEVKSVHSLAFWAHLEELKDAYLHHRLQLYTYLRAKEMNGKIFYVSRDDLCLQEVDVPFENAHLEGEWRKDVETITDYHNTNTQPPKEPNLIFNQKKREYQANKWKVGGSGYLTHLTGYRTKGEWLEVAEKEARKKNRELKCQVELEHYRKKYKDEFRKEKKK